MPRGLQVRAGDRPSSKPRAADTSPEHVPFDFLDRTSWDGALRDCDGLFLLRPPALSDMDASLNPFIDRAYGAGVKHIVVLSVSGAERREWVPHRKVERHLEASGQAWTLLRPGFFAQNLQDAHRRDVIEDGRLYVPAGSAVVAFLDVRDAAEVAALIFEQPQAFVGKALTLTGPEAVTFGEVARILSSMLGRTSRYEPASILGYARHLHFSRGLPWVQVAVQTYLHWGLRRGEAATGDVTIEKLLGSRASSVSDYVLRSLGVWR